MHRDYTRVPTAERKVVIVGLRVEVDVVQLLRLASTEDVKVFG